ncbi:uncharacterized protein I303_103745 [Kwoniella dejecticola CBS 10117]|uniref:PPM-type phosphatase domain-containing protein n=1 Tax=Kwoniella dejecticola CBS 10117 TaxID=1296121 RepID=A0A1A6A7K9_9TREE|nr:uncharacterized protein I303_03762 [Kwoniella dejecticola CBS 10117]OBR86044.1 hypothetical protein I303_03762 [Kwoniella dejecticola CBS 10117]
MSIQPVKLNEISDPPITKTTQSDGNEAFIQVLPGPLVKVWGLTGPYDAKNREWEGTFYIRPQSETETFLKQNSKSFDIALPPGDKPGVRPNGWDENVVPSNALCEDRRKIDMIPISRLQFLLEKSGAKDGSFWKEWYEAKNIASKHLKVTTGKGAVDGEVEVGSGSHELDKAGPDEGHLMFFSVFDGMGGTIVSDMISKTLHACVALTLARLKQDITDNSIDVETLTKALKDTYVALQADFTEAAPAALRGLITRENSSPILPGLNPSNFLFGATEGAGCTACSIIVDTQLKKMYVAHVGDSRAVAGWWNKKEKKWRCDVLTEDQCGDNPKECARRLARHPPEEASKVIYDRGWGNRILGTNDVVRKFGGSYSVRPHEEENEIWNAFQTKQAFNFFPKITPPYTDTEPAVDIRDLSTVTEEELKFVTLATDGIWERIASEEAVLLVAAYKHDPTQGEVSRMALAEKYPLMAPGEDRKFPIQDLPGTGSRAEGSWTFEGDADASTHLIRNVLGGSDKEWRRQVLSMRESASRQMRDDLTAV